MASAPPVFSAETAVLARTSSVELPVVDQCFDVDRKVPLAAVCVSDASSPGSRASPAPSMGSTVARL